MWRQDPAFPQRCASSPSSEVGQYDGPGPEQPSHPGTENPLLAPPAPSAEHSGQGVWLLPSGEPARGRPSHLSLKTAASRRGQPRGACSSSCSSSPSPLPPSCLFITLPSSAVSWRWVPGAGGGRRSSRGGGRVLRPRASSAPAVLSCPGPSCSVAGPPVSGGAGRAETAPQPLALGLLQGQTWPRHL